MENGLFTDFSVGLQVNVYVSHLQFIDDTLLVEVKSWANVSLFKTILLLFEEISVLKVNFHKIVLFGVNVVKSWLHEVALVMNFKHERRPFFVLGVVHCWWSQKAAFLVSPDCEY